VGHSKVAECDKPDLEVDHPPVGLQLIAEIAQPLQNGPE
jgi:hypothetical protein